MRRTTISRSRIPPLLTVGLLLGAPVARAQDTLQMGAPPQRPQVHIVQQGETLWALAELYYGDPLLWPAIYRLNTMVVEDPHWIYPGEELQLGAGADAALAVAEPAAPEAVPQDTIAGAPSDTVTGQPVAVAPSDTTLVVERPT